MAESGTLRDDHRNLVLDEVSADFLAERMVRRFHEISNKGAPPRVSINPSSFNKTTTLGRTALITYAPTSDQIAQGIAESQNVAFWQGTKVESQAMTIDIGAVLTPTPTPKAIPRPSARPYALIQYGTDGNIQNAVSVDVGTGQRLTVNANYISVTVGMDPPRTGQPSPVISLGASISAFAAPTTAPVVRSVYFDDLAANLSTDLFVIPLRARMLLVPSPIAVPGNFGNPFPGIIQLFFFDYGGSHIGEWAWNFATGVGLVAVPIPPDAYQFSLVTNTADTYVRVPFQLSL